MKPNIWWDCPFKSVTCAEPVAEGLVIHLKGKVRTEKEPTPINQCMWRRKNNPTSLLSRGEPFWKLQMEIGGGGESSIIFPPLLSSSTSGRSSGFCHSCGSPKDSHCLKPSWQNGSRRRTRFLFPVPPHPPPTLSRNLPEIYFNPVGTYAWLIQTQPLSRRIV